jgi:hypothetical protein
MTTPPKLLGKYRTPRIRGGSVAVCARRGEVRVVGLSEAPIPWPTGRPPKGRGHGGMVLFAGLADAVRRESVSAVAYWWAVTAQTVTVWRRALGVDEHNEGTTALTSDVHSPILDRARDLAMPTLSSPERREKIAAGKRGKARPPHVIEAMRKGRTGKPQSEDARRRMSATHRRRGTLVPGTRVWTAEEDDLVRTLPPSQVVERTGRTLVAVWSRRRVLGLPDGRARR